jgi:branched-chain amino acid transport system substrate-binding protein
MKEMNMNTVSRRSILKTVGVTAAAFASTPILSKAETISHAALSASSHKKAGIIIPQSANKINSASFLNGIDLYLAQYAKEHGAVPFAPIIETSVSSSSALESSIAKLIGRHNIDIAVAYTNSRITQPLAGLIETAKIPFVEANLGENVFRTDSKYCFHSSLNLWQAHYMLGKYAAEHSGKLAVSIGSFYDSAYDAHYAFEAGFTANGGTVINRITTGSPSDHFSPIEAASLAASNEAPVIFVNYSGSDASVFLSALRGFDAIGSKHLYGSSMLASDKINIQSAEGIISAYSWQRDTAGSFSTAYNEAYRSHPNDLAMLGYDTAAMITSAITKAGKNASGEKLALAFETISFDSARGRIAMNSATHSTEAPVSIYAIGGNTITTQAIAETDLGLSQEHRSGAINVYPFMS